MSGITGVVGTIGRLPSLSASLDQHTLFTPSGSPSTAVTLTPVGGVGSFTCAWTLISGGGVTVTSPTSASTTFNGFGSTATYRCTATDAAGQHAYDDVSVTFFTL